MYLNKVIDLRITILDAISLSIIDCVWDKLLVRHDEVIKLNFTSYSVITLQGVALVTLPVGNDDNATFKILLIKQHLSLNVMKI